MRSLDVAIRNPSGLHARPAALFVRTAGGFKSRILLENVTRGSAAGDAKSILAVLAQGVSMGSSIRIVAEGEDEDLAIEALRNLIESGVGEKLEA